MLFAGLSECQWVFFNGAVEKEATEEEEKTSTRLIHKVNNQDNVPSGKLKVAVLSWL